MNNNKNQFSILDGVKTGIRSDSTSPRITAEGLTFAQVTMGDRGIYELKLECSDVAELYRYTLSVNRLPTSYTRVIETYVNSDVTLSVGREDGGEVSGNVVWYYKKNDDRGSFALLNPNDSTKVCIIIVHRSNELYKIGSTPYYFSYILTFVAYNTHVQ